MKKGEVDKLETFYEWILHRFQYRSATSYTLISKTDIRMRHLPTAALDKTKREIDGRKRGTETNEKVEGTSMCDTAELFAIHLQFTSCYLHAVFVGVPSVPDRALPGPRTRSPKVVEPIGAGVA